MTDKERLERVEALLHWADKYQEGGNERLVSQTVNQIYQEFHIDWLIEKANRVQQLEEENQQVKESHKEQLGEILGKAEAHLLRNGKEIMKLTNEKAELQYQNQRYNEAMTTAIGEAECIMYQGKSKDVDVEYARNIKRYLTDALEGEE